MWKVETWQSCFSLPITHMSGLTYEHAILIAKALKLDGRIAMASPE